MLGQFETQIYYPQAFFQVGTLLCQGSFLMSSCSLSTKLRTLVAAMEQLRIPPDDKSVPQNAGQYL